MGRRQGRPAARQDWARPLNVLFHTAGAAALCCQQQSSREPENVADADACGRHTREFFLEETQDRTSTID